MRSSTRIATLEATNADGSKNQGGSSGGNGASSKKKRKAKSSPSKTLNAEVMIKLNS